MTVEDMKKSIWSEFINGKIFINTPKCFLNSKAWHSSKKTLLFQKSFPKI